MLSLFHLIYSESPPQRIVSLGDLDQSTRYIEHANKQEFSLEKMPILLISTTESSR